MDSRRTPRTDCSIRSLRWADTGIGLTRVGTVPRCGGRLLGVNDSSPEEPQPAVAQRLEGDPSLYFTQRNAVETMAIHWGLALGVLGVAVGLKWAEDLALDPLLLAGLLLQVVGAVVVSILCIHAVRTGATFDTTDRWDGPTALLPVLGTSLAIAGTGGITSPMWLGPNRWSGVPGNGAAVRVPLLGGGDARAAAGRGIVR